MSDMVNFHIKATGARYVKVIDVDGSTKTPYTQPLADKATWDVTARGPAPATVDIFYADKLEDLNKLPAPIKTVDVKEDETINIPFS